MKPNANTILSYYSSQELVLLANQAKSNEEEKAQKQKQWVIGNADEIKKQMQVLTTLNEKISSLKKSMKDPEITVRVLNAKKEKLLSLNIILNDEESKLRELNDYEYHLDVKHNRFPEW